MPRFRSVALAAVLLSGCTRDLDLPSKSTLAVTQPMVDAAPRQQLDIGLQGGSGGYRFAFAAGGQLSGSDATVDAATGHYQAGSDGSAQDAIEVRDSSGARVVARVSVHGRVSITPGIAGVAPGGTVLFSVAGGMTPYVSFELESAPSGGRIVLPGASTFTYFAGSTGEVTDVVVVKDSTGDPKACARVQIRVGTRLGLLAASDQVAPGEQVSILAVGGEPPYSWKACAPPSCTGAAPSGGDFLNAAGLYRAGANGNVTDLIQVTDHNGETASLALTVGARLRLSIPGGASPDLRPGVAVQLLAEGGKAPYKFGFAVRGNRSGGKVEPVTGLYTPGDSVGARDLLAVVDAAGLTTTAWNPAAVQAQMLPIDSGSIMACWSAELNRDTSGDVLLADWSFRLTEVTAIGSGAPQVESYELGITSSWDTRRRHGPQTVLWGDWNGDGRDDLVTSDPVDGVRFYLTDLLGNLVQGPTFPGSASTSFSPLQAARVVGSDGSQLLYTSGSIPPGQFCVDGPSSAGYGIVRLRYVPGTVPSLVPECVSQFMNFGSPRRMIAGDFDGDGFTDIAMIDDMGDGYTLSRDLRVLWGANDPNGIMQTATVVPNLLPSTVVLGYSYDDYDAHVRVLSVPHGLLFRVEDVATGRGLVVAARCDPVTRQWTASAPFDPAPGRQGILGLAAYTPVASPTTYVGWNGVDGELTAIDVDLAVTGFALRSSQTVTPAPLPYAVRCVAFPDVNADGAPDLVTAKGEVILGRGAYGVGALAGEPRFGGRIHFRTVAYGAPGDFDEDGLLDLLGTGDAGLTLFLGSDGQLARGGDVPIGAQPGMVWAGKLFDAHLSAIVQDATGALHAVRGLGDGTFADPVLMQVVDTSGNPALLSPSGGDSASEVVGGIPLLVAFQTNTTLQVGVVKDTSHIVVATSPPVPDPNVDHCAMNVIHGGAAGTVSLAMLCAVVPAGEFEAHQGVVRVITVSNLAGTPTFGSWSAPVAITTNPLPERLDIGSASGGSGDAVLWSYFRGRKEVHVFTVGMSAVVEDALPTNLHADYAGVLAPLRTGGPEDLVIGASNGLLLLRRTATTPAHWAIAQELLGGAGVPYAAGTLAPGAPPSLLTATGLDRSTAGLQPELVVVETDGTGFLR
jgi:hypothetical protein